MVHSLARGFGADLYLAARRLLATPLFTLFAVCSLAVGVGVTTAMYSVVDSVFLKELGLPDPEGLVFVVTPYEARLLKGSISQPDFDDLRAARRSFSSLSASRPFESAVALPSTTELLAGEAVDGAYFTTLGVGVRLGRPIHAADTAAAARVAVISDGLWRRRFSANPAIVGQTIRVGSGEFEIIGVTARSFDGVNGPVPGTKLWIPLAAEAADPRDQRRLIVFGRLTASATVAGASAEVAAIAAGLDLSFPPPARGRHPGATERPWTAKSAPHIIGADSFVHRFGILLVALVALVLVVACTNLANLVLARGTGRQQELAVRYALGAPRWRLVREQCAESALLALGGAAAAGLVFQLLQALMDVEFNLSLPMGGRWLLSIRPELDARAAVLAAGSLCLSLLVFGLEPALRVTRAADLRGEIAGGISRPRARRQRTLLRWQVAVSAGFFIIATMFVKYTLAEARHDSGVQIDRLGVATLNWEAQRWDGARVRRTLDRVLEEARQEPSVHAVSVSTGMPFGTPGRIRLTLSIPGQRPATAADVHRASGIAVAPGFLATIGVPILQGRSFTVADNAGSLSVAIVSAFTSRVLFGREDAVGRQLSVQTQGGGSTVVTVVGVARDTDVGMILGDPYLFVYLPLAQRTEPFQTVVARSTGEAAIAVRAVRNILRRADPELAAEAIGTGRTVLSGPFVFLRAAGVAALALAVLTLLLAMAGLFGVQSHIVTLRTQEIGVRMSLGATAGRVKRMILADGSRPVIEGLAIGLLIGVAGRAVARSYLEIDASVIDPWMLVIVPIPLILAGWCACYLPARRAAAVDPNVALRHL